MKLKTLTILSLMLVLNTPVFAASNQELAAYSKDLESSDIKKQEVAYSFFLKNANSNVNALYRLGRAYYYGYGTKKDMDTALGIYAKAVSLNYGPAFTALGIHAVEVENNVPKGLDYLVKALDHEDGLAGYYIGKLYDEGKYVEKNEYYAIKYYAMGAAEGNSNAQYNVGLKMLTSGDSSNYPKGLNYLKRAASNKHKQACLELANLYITENNYIKTSVREHINYLSCAAIAGDYDSQKKLAEYYRDGKMVSADDKKAAFFYELYLGPQNTNRDAESFYNAGLVNMRLGNGDTAKKYLEAAASKGSAEAAYVMAKMYENGYGTKINLKQAFDYYKLSQSHGKDTIEDIIRIESLIKK